MKSEKKVKSRLDLKLKGEMGTESLTTFLWVVVLCNIDIGCVQSVCNDGNAQAFVVIEPDQYDMNYSSISSIGKRPFGFEKSTWYYNSQTESNPCIKVTGASNRRVEIMIEAIPQSRLCVKSPTKEYGCADSGTGRFYSCKPAVSDTISFEFYCDNTCAEHDVQFWYRLVLGETPDQDPEDHWCDNRSHDQYPNSLLQLPPGYDPPVEMTTPFNSCRSLHAFTGFSTGLSLALSLVTFSQVFHRKLC